MKPISKSDDDWWAEAFKKCHGGVAIKPFTSVTLKQLRKVWPNYVPKKKLK